MQIKCSGGGISTFLQPLQQHPFAKWWELVGEGFQMKRFYNSRSIYDMIPKFFAGSEGGSVAVPTSTGFAFYSIEDTEKPELIYANDEGTPRIIERLHHTNLVAMVFLSSPRTVHMLHLKKRKKVCAYSYYNTIVAIRMSKTRLVVILEESLYIYNLSNMKRVHTIKDTPPNPLGISALGLNSGGAILAYPCSIASGDVQLFDTDNMISKIMIPAHHSTISALAISPNSTRLATASEKGTLIRVFSVATGHKLFEFRRGLKRCVDVSCLTFSSCGKYLCVSSNTETVHVFNFEESSQSPKCPADDNSWMKYFSSYLPTQVSDVLTQDRAYAVAYLPRDGVRSNVALVTINKKMRLLVATEENNLYIYNLAVNDRGEVTLFKEYDLSCSPLDAASFEPLDSDSDLDKDAKHTASAELSDLDSDLERDLEHVGIDVGVEELPPQLHLAMSL